MITVMWMYLVSWALLLGFFFAVFWDNIDVPDEDVLPVVISFVVGPVAASVLLGGVVLQATRELVLPYYEKRRRAKQDRLQARFCGREPLFKIKV